MRNYGTRFPKSALAVFTLFGAAFAQTDSTDLLFDDQSVREYSFTFYASDYKTKLEANWAADSGYVAAKFSDGKITLDSVGVRYKGNSSYSAIGSSPKKPFKVKFNEFKSGQTYYGTKVLNFSNGYGDPTFLREKIAYDVSRAYLPTPRASFATISIGTTLIGLYTQVEQADKSFLSRWYLDSDQNLFKAGDDGAYLAWEGSDAQLYTDNLELKTNESENDWSGMVSFLNLVNNSTSAEFCSKYQNFMDLHNVTKFLAFNMVFSHFDSYTGSGRNYYMYQTLPSGYMQFIPWDMNLAFGGYTNGWNVYTQSALKIGNLANRPLTKQILSCKTTHDHYLGWIREMIKGEASTDSIQAKINRLSPIIRPYVINDPNKFYRIGAFDTNLTTRYRASATELIPGLIEFSTTRNAFLLGEVEDSLDADFTLPITNSTSNEVSIGLRFNGYQWVLEGADNLKNVRIDFSNVRGDHIGRFVSESNTALQPLNLPAGLVVVRVFAQGFRKTFIIQNTPRSGQ